MPDLPHTPKTVREHLTEMLQVQSEATEMAMTQMDDKRKAMKEYFDRKANDIVYKPGDIVYVYCPQLKTRKTKKKLQKSFFGPYVVTKQYNLTSVFLKKT